MHQSRPFAPFGAMIAALVLICQGAAAQAPPQPRPVGPVARPIGIAQPPAALAATMFATIHVTLVGPNSVKIEWSAYPGADSYCVYRNGIPIGPTPPACPTAAQGTTAYDNSAPANSKLNYYVTAAQKQQQYTTAGQPAFVSNTLLATSGTVAVVTPPDLVRTQLAALPALYLRGWVDLHAHPMSYLGFGGKLIYGAVDDQARRPPSCPSRGPLNSENDFYGAPVPMLLLPPPLGPGVPTPCGNAARFTLIELIEGALSSHFWPPESYMVSGPPGYITWPTWDDALRQKMWWEWIYRAYQGGQRVMVALAVNNKLLGDAVLGGNSQFDLPTDDLQSAEIQIAELVSFVGRHDFMKIAHSSAELRDIVSQNKLAVVMGVEIDNIGNLVGNVPAPLINAAVDHLFNEGVRYIFPIHLVNNPIGKTALYEDMFLVANAYEEGAPINLMCVPPNQNIRYQYSPTDDRVAMIVNNGPAGLTRPTPVPCDQNNGWGNINGGDLDASGRPILDSAGRPVGLSQAGKQAIQHMMDLGMLIDIDHMSGSSVDQTLAIAAQNTPVPYPLFSGHNNVRASAGDGSFKERQLTAAQYTELFARHGMAGMGAAKTPANLWLSSVVQTLTQGNAVGRPFAFGTDADGMEFMMPPRPGSNVNTAAALPPPAIPLAPAKTGLKTWDYNHDGVAHYGLLPDFLLDVQQGGQLGAAVVNQMFNGAQYFYDTWVLAERDAIKPCPTNQSYDKRTQACVAR